MPLPHNHLWIRQPELLVPMRKPRGLLRYNPASRIRKDVLLPFDSWQQVGDGGSTPMGRNIGLRQDIQFGVSMNHAGPYEHWFPDDLGIKNEYGGTYANAECLTTPDGVGTDILLTYNDNVWSGGAVWTCNRDDISGSGIAYALLGEYDSAGHVENGFTVGIALDNATTLVVSGNQREAIYTGLPSFITPGKTYSVVVKCWRDGADYTRAKLWINGIYYGEGVASTALGSNYQYSKMAAVTAFNSHHNRVIDGTVHMVWASSYHPPDDICRQESFDPFQTVLPA